MKGMTLDNLVLLLGILGSLMLAGVALYRARPQRELDAVTKHKVEQEVKTAAEEHDREKTVRIIRLERYVTKDVTYHRQSERYQAEQTRYQMKLVELLEKCIDAELMHSGCLPVPPGEPPVPPELPDVEI